MALQTRSSIAMPPAPPAAPAPESRKTWLVTATSLVFIVLQSACTAVIALSGVRVAIGLSALASATFGIHPPPTGFHSDAIRIPMMIAATLGSLINLYVLWRIRSLRTRPSSQWRTQPATPSQRRSEFLQITLAIATLLLVAAEGILHSLLHHAT
ncbi:hypothetical protein [Tunturibacter empetritectus]|uniref:Uncharacterized protein n=1 Tax=Tunturiibacter empetritectus TaxID=3069691 RepID=A0A7W8IE21_9BACT|nr:hypothetical protein [Edaphobacter lichenicola]MBB5315455.1 hypothetical protein [Edaphobacter lichenicola]